ncbi:hypothetical protein [Fundidesulfovibrio magnetotacticus]|nr:hypothetical protein [Fundidesulfovibrio magnetotacticus]
MALDRSRDAIRCQAFVNAGLVGYVAELINYSDVVAWTFFLDSLISWKTQTDFRFDKSLVATMYAKRDDMERRIDVVRDTFVKDEELRNILKGFRGHVKDLLDRWPYASSEMGTPGEDVFSGLGQKYLDLERASQEAISTFQNISMRFDPLSGGFSMDGDQCVEPLIIHGMTQRLALRIHSVMTMALLYGVTQHYKDIPEVKAQEAYAVAGLNFMLFDFEESEKTARQIGELGNNPAVRKAAAEFRAQYATWRAALDAALASDGLALPGDKAQ